MLRVLHSFKFLRTKQAKERQTIKVVCYFLLKLKTSLNLCFHLFFVFFPFYCFLIVGLLECFLLLLGS